MSASKLQIAFDPEFDQIWERVRPFTMTSKERGYALYQAVRYVVSNSIPGSFVECGVWRGGSAMLMALTLLQLKVRNRNIILFDTFSGMTSPDAVDVDVHGRSADVLLQNDAGDKAQSLMWAYASREDVEANLATVGYPQRHLRLVEGDVAETLRGTHTGLIALLRLDTDFYESTRCELEELYPRVRRDAVVLIDDYGHWKGCRQAVDEFFAAAPADARRRPLMTAVDYTGVIFVKPDDATRLAIERYDYVPPGCSAPGLLRLFEFAVEDDPTTVRWPYLRSAVPHIWRRDGRQNTKAYKIGYLSLEEAVVLHALAGRFAGRRGLEIGCHFGWSTAHILSAGVDLDVVDPALAEQDRWQAVSTALERTESSAAFRLWAGFSPSILPAVAAAGDGGPWSFVFIDGDHSGDAPERDAAAVLPYCADTAMVVLHDLVSPDVARGLDVFRKAGWNTRIYNTMQIMGVAWRGDVEPLDHQADPNVTGPYLAHLAAYLPKAAGVRPAAEGTAAG